MKWSSHPMHEKRRYEGPRFRAPRGAQRGTTGRSVFLTMVRVIDPLRGHSPVAVGPYFQYAIVGKFPI